MNVEEGDGMRWTVCIEPGTTMLAVRCVNVDGTQQWQQALDVAGDAVVTARSRGRLYVVSYPVSAAGCRVVAMSEVDGTILWDRMIEGPRPVLHSKYRNEVRAVPTEDGIRVEGRESAGNYRELLDAVTGSTLCRVAETP
ncbi:MAG: hypothetical protein ACRDRV_21965 [Pseudonocardiaceae bacterium]